MVMEKPLKAGEEQDEALASLYVDVESKMKKQV